MCNLRKVLFKFLYAVSDYGFILVGKKKHNLIVNIFLSAKIWGFHSLREKIQSERPKTSNLKINTALSFKTLVQN